MKRKRDVQTSNSKKIQAKNSKGFSKADMDRIGRMTDQEREASLTPEQFRNYHVQKLLMGDEVQSNKRTTKKLIANQLGIDIQPATKSSSGSECVDIISKLLHSLGISREFSHSDMVLQLIESYLIRFFNRILEKLKTVVEKRKEKNKSLEDTEVSLDELIKQLFPNVKLIRIVEYYYALVQYICKQQQKYKKLEKDEAEAEEESSDLEEYHSLEEENSKEDADHAGAGCIVSSESQGYQLFYREADWKATGLETSKDKFLEDIHSGRLSRKTTRARVVVPMDVEQLKYFHTCCTARMGGNHQKFYTWLSTNTLLSKESYTLDRRATSGLSFIADHRILELTQTLLPSITAETSMLQFQELVQKRITEYDDDDLTFFPRAK
jgi:hypothetical protein